MQENPFAPDPNLNVYIDGHIVPVSQAKVCVFDHGLLYGDGVFEGIRIYGGRIFEEQAHIRRFYESAKAIKCEVPMAPDQLSDTMYETMRANNITGDGYIRLLLTRGVGNLGINPLQTAQPNIIIIAATIQLYPEELYETGMSAVTATTIRNHPNSLSPRIKSLNYLNNILAKIEALDAGVHECIMLNHEGYVAEGTGDNLFIVRNGTIMTPPASAGILEGITRGVVIKLARRRKLPVAEKTLIRHDLYVAEELFMTGTAAEVIAVTQVDHRPIGTGKPGPLTQQLKEDFRAYTRGEFSLD
jgi:branched-chain amino acid aminotransferase